MPPQIEEVSLPELFANNSDKRGGAPFARFRELESGTFREISWHQAAQDVFRTALFLREKFGVQRGERAGIFASTRYEWIVADLAILSLCAVSVSMYHSLTSA